MSFEERTPNTLKLPRLISDGMVLQRDAPLKIWGWAGAGEAVTVQFIEHTYRCKAGADGKWNVVLPALGAGGPYEMDITADVKITIRNILIGDVWVCAGQSNMQLTMDRVKDKYPEEITACAEPNIRLFIVPERYDFIVRNEDFETGGWISPEKEMILQFTAVGYFFAQEVLRKYHVPVGLIAAAIGGTPAESWLSEEALSAFPYALERIKPFRQDGYLAALIQKEQRIASDWFEALNQADKGNQNGAMPWYDERFDASGWETIPVPSFWADEGLGPVNGAFWFRKEVDVPATMTGIPARLELGRIVDSDSVYINGTFVGSVSYQYPPRKYDVPVGLLRAGKNIITVRIVSNSGKGGFVEDKPYHLTAGAQSIDLKGLWQYKIGAVSEPSPEQLYPPSLPLAFYNGMIAPLFTHRIKGVIWYQGESNLNNCPMYEALFKTLIAVWRKGWHQGDFPFLFVQLPNFAETLYPEFDSAWSLVREAQLRTLEVPNTGMAVAIDLGEWNDLHPLDKKNVAHRLFLAARQAAYGDNDVVYSGPRFQSATVFSGKVALTFDSVGSGLAVKGSLEPDGFQLSGPDGKFYAAHAKIDGDTVIVWSDAVPVPSEVRYAWADNPEGANLYNAESLPASPFRARL